MVNLFLYLGNLWGRFRKSELVKVFSFTSVATFIRILTGFVSTKILAYLIGPPGIALLGQLNNFTAIILNIASGGINTGVVKYVSEYKTDHNQVKSYISTAFKIALTGAGLCGVFMLIFHSFLSNKILFTDQYGYVFIIFGLTIVFYVINNLLLSVLNGYKEFKRYVSVGIISSFLGLIFTVSLVYFFRLPGILISVVTFQSIILVVTVWKCRKFEWFSHEYFFSGFSKVVASRYFKYSLMTLIAALSLPVVQLVLRGHVISQVSITSAGWWEAMNRVSGIYLMVITTSFSVYYLPRLSEIQDRAELKTEILKAYKLIVPFMLVGFILIYFFKGFIIRLLYTPEFLPMKDLFGWQLIGDFFKICSWLISYIMIAKALTKTYIITEILATSFYLLMSIYLVNQNGITGIVQAYMLNYILYFIVMLFVMRKYLFSKKNI